MAHTLQSGQMDLLSYVDNLKCNVSDASVDILKEYGLEVVPPTAEHNGRPAATGGGHHGTLQEASSLSRSERRRHHHAKQHGIDTPQATPP